MRQCSFYFTPPLFSQSDFNHQLSSKTYYSISKISGNRAIKLSLVPSPDSNIKPLQLLRQRLVSAITGWLTREHVLLTYQTSLTRELHPQWDHLYRICTRWDLSQSCIHCCSGYPKRSNHSLVGSAAPVTGFTVKAPLKLSRPSLDSLPSPT